MKHPPQESDLVPVRTVALVGLGVIVATVIGIAVAQGIASCRIRDLGVIHEVPAIPPEVSAVETRTFPIEAQGLDMHARAERFLESYGWIDRDRRIIHVPIDVAIDLWLARHREGAR